MTSPAPHPGRHPGFRTGAQVWLLRHGEVHRDWAGVAYGSMDVPLSERGARSTAEVARSFAALCFSAVVASPLRRALELGQALAGLTGAPLLVEPGLAEIHRGRWQGMDVAELLERHSGEVEAFYTDPWSWSGHGGETDADLLARAWPALERAVRHHGGTLAVAAHYNVIRVLLARALGVDPHRSFRLRIDLGAACLLRDGDEGWRLERLNVRGPSAIETV